MIFYNENDPGLSEWLSNLTGSGWLSKGEIDARSICDIRSADLDGYHQCHFFAGCGGWPLALRLAGWPEDREVWTGSCPCQPFSIAGKRKGVADDRHLWPIFFELIRERRPDVVFGEQVASPEGIVWLESLCADLEEAGYAVAPFVLPALAVGAYHWRSRIFFVAESVGLRLRGRKFGDRTKVEGALQTAGLCVNGGLADPGTSGLSLRKQQAFFGTRRREEGGTVKQFGSNGNFWDHVERLFCTDGKSRPTEPGIFPVAYGIPRSVGQAKSRLGTLSPLATTGSLAAARKNRVLRLKGYGNAIVPQLAAEFIMAYLDL